MYQLAIVAVILCFLFKVLNVNNSPKRSLFYCANAKFLEEILKNAPSLAEPFVPTRLWGFSGHVQTIIQSMFSRIYCPMVNGKRYFFFQSDGTKVTYDLYQAIEQHTLNEDYTLIIVPGIGNSSESVYIRRVVYQAQFQGYRVAVLNHVGTLRNVQITSHRIFCYGNTDDLEGLVQDLVKRFPGSKQILLGFSMGGNVVTKYLGEDNKKKPDNIIAGISACQGYDAVRATNFLLQWEGFRRVYLFLMTENMKRILRHWHKQLFTDEIKREKGIVERDVWAAATIVELDDAYTRKMANVDSVEEFYRVSSSHNYFDNIKVPMIFLNAVDDPIVPPPLLDIIKKAIRTHENFLYIEQQYGGHLGFYEGGFICPNSVTWLDRNVVNLADALTIFTSLGKGKMGMNKHDCEEKAMLSLFEDELTPSNSSEQSPVLVRKVDNSVKKTKPTFVCKKRKGINIKAKIKVTI